MDRSPHVYGGGIGEKATKLGSGVKKASAEQQALVDAALSDETIAAYQKPVPAPAD